jgi:hypothetical protein
MNAYGWIIFLASNISIIALIIFCFHRVFSLPQEHMHAPLDIDTKDQED